MPIGAKKKDMPLKYKAGHEMFDGHKKLQTKLLGSMKEGSPAEEMSESPSEEQAEMQGKAAFVKKPKKAGIKGGY